MTGIKPLKFDWQEGDLLRLVNLAYAASPEELQGRIYYFTGYDDEEGRRDEDTIAYLRCLVTGESTGFFVWRLEKVETDDE